MKRYEVVCEAYNTCSPKPLISVDEVETEIWKLIFAR